MRLRMYPPLLALGCVIAVPLKALAGQAPGAGERPRHPLQADASVVLPYTTQRVHNVGNICFTVSNWGFLGSGLRGERDPCTNRPAPSFEFPAGSGVEYLFQGAIWIGGVKGRDTLVSVGWDGWYANYEFFPAPYPEGQIIERTNRETLEPPGGSTCPEVMFSDDAVSEQDFVAVYSDTAVDPGYVVPDLYDGAHRPLGLEVTQSSFAWSHDYAENFIIVDYRIQNIDTMPLGRLYLGVLVDPDIGHYLTGEFYSDDMTGMLRAMPADLACMPGESLYTAWAIDNDGDPVGGVFDRTSPTGIVGLKVLRAPPRADKISFNWWISNSTPSRDWGPHLRSSYVPGRFPSGNLGTPEGDLVKYLTMANGEMDYDQMEAAIDHSAQGWLPPLMNPTLAQDIASGFDTRYLLSVGPFDLAPDATLPLTIALVAGADLHTNPRNFSSYFDASYPERYSEGLNFDPLIRNVRWASWVFDTPGYDTDGNGYAGEYRIEGNDTIYCTGDGVPDFRGPAAPPVPTIHFSRRDGLVVVKWNGEESETARDRFSHLRDFEGYRVYFGRSWSDDDMVFVSQRDRIDYQRFAWDPVGLIWRADDVPLTLDSLRGRFAWVQDSLGYPFHPDSFPGPTPDRALWEITQSPRDPLELDTAYYAFAPFDANESADDVGLFKADSLGLDVARVIRKVYPYATPDDVAYRDGGEEFKPYYEYEYAMDGLYLADPVIFAVTTFDFGDPPSLVGPQETSPRLTGQAVIPLELADSTAAGAERPRPGLYPNPYRLADDYRGGGWEPSPDVEPDPERARRITFYNLPGRCTISIWTLDGDLVRRLEHSGDAFHIGTYTPGVEVWNMINRNGNRITTGLYIYSIESEHGVDVGKLAVIR